MTSKQRAYLRSLANPLEAIVHVGKGGMMDTIVKQADDALKAAAFSTKRYTGETG